MGLVLFLVCLLASGIGSICGIGGGVIIKPVIDMQGIMSVNEASFLSGLTVMAMAMVNIIMRRKTRLLDMRIGSLLALGSVAGGVLLGVCSAFLGIGGGPINIAVLTLAFSMDTKKAAATSLYIIAFSQLSNLASSVLKGTVPQFVPMELVLMVSAGILGGLVGSEISKKISTETTNKLLAVFLVVVIIMCVYNAYRFGGEVICRR